MLYQIQFTAMKFTTFLVEYICCLIKKNLYDAKQMYAHKL